MDKQSGTFVNVSTPNIALTGANTTDSLFWDENTNPCFQHVPEFWSMVAIVW